jgi:hypothetical protein
VAVPFALGHVPLKVDPRLVRRPAELLADRVLAGERRLGRWLGLEPERPEARGRRVPVVTADQEVDVAHRAQGPVGIDGVGQVDVLQGEDLDAARLEGADDVADGREQAIVPVPVVVQQPGQLVEDLGRDGVGQPRAPGEELLEPVGNQRCDGVADRRVQHVLPVDALGDGVGRLRHVGRAERGPGARQQEAVFDGEGHETSQRTVA